MTARNEVERRSHKYKDFALRWLEKAGGSIGAQRLVTIATDGDVEEATFNAAKVVGVNGEDFPRVAGDEVEVGYGRVFVVADQAIVAGQALKAAGGGRVTQLVDSALAGAA